MGNEGILKSHGARLFCWMVLCVTLTGCGSDESRKAGEANQAASGEPGFDTVLTRHDSTDGKPTADGGNHLPLVQPNTSCSRWPIPDSQASLDSACTIEELEHDYRMDRRATDAKYSGKLLEISGMLVRAGKNLGGDPIVRLRGSDERFEVGCVLRSVDELLNARIGERCRIRGAYCVSVIPTFIHCTIAESTQSQPVKKPRDPPEMVSSDRRPPEITLTADQLNSELAANPQQTTEKYAGRIMQVSGRLSRISHLVAGEIVYRLDSEAMSVPLGVQCYVRSGSPWFCARPGQTVTLVGEGCRSYPALVNCEVTSIAGTGDPIIAAQVLGEYLESDAADFSKRFYLRQLLVRGEVMEKSSPEDIGDEVTITLRSTTSSKIICEMEEAEFAASESVRVGDVVTIAGWNTNAEPTDAVKLVRSLFWRGE